MTDRFDLVPKSQLPARGTVNARLDPKVRAKIRRDAGDRAQLSWDASLDPAEMLRALLEEQPDPSIILPAAKFMETANTLFGQRGTRVHPAVWTQTMRTVAKLILKGNFGTATIFLRHACTGAGLARDPDEAYGAMTSVVREFFPSAPETWTGPRVTTERARLLEGDEQKMLEMGEG